MTRVLRMVKHHQARKTSPNPATESLSSRSKPVTCVAPQVPERPTMVHTTIESLPRGSERAGESHEQVKIVRREDGWNCPYVIERKSRSENPSNLSGGVALDDHGMFVDRKLSPSLESTQSTSRHKKRCQKDDFGYADPIEYRTEKWGSRFQESPNLLGNYSEVRFVTQGKARISPIKRVFAELVDERNDLRGGEITRENSFGQAAIASFLTEHRERFPRRIARDDSLSYTCEFQRFSSRPAADFEDALTGHHRIPDKTERDVRRMCEHRVVEKQTIVSGREGVVGPSAFTLRGRFRHPIRVHEFALSLLSPLLQTSAA